MNERVVCEDSFDMKCFVTVTIDIRVGYEVRGRVLCLLCPLETLIVLNLATEGYLDALIALWVLSLPIRCSFSPSLSH